MKTAMQELIERLDKTENQLEKENNLVMSSALFAAKSMALEALEKEKEQIKTAFESGWNWNFSSEKYYNETYNPAPYQHKANEFKDNDKIEINPITGDVKIITNEKN